MKCVDTVVIFRVSRKIEYLEKKYKIVGKIGMSRSSDDVVSLNCKNSSYTHLSIQVHRTDLLSKLPEKKFFIRTFYLTA